MRHTIWFALALLLLARGGAAAQDEKKDAPKPPVDVPGFWTADELRRIDEGLEVINCTRKDLGFQKRPIDDPFRLTVVNRILDDPLSIGPVAAEWDVAARTGDPRTILTHAVDLMGPPTRHVGSYVGGQSPDMGAPEIKGRLPASCRSQLDDLLSLMLMWRDRVRDAGPQDATDWPALYRKALLSQVEHPQTPIEAPDIEDARFLERLRGLDVARLRAAGTDLVESVGALAAKLRAAGPGTWAEWRGTSREKTEIGDIVLAGVGDDLHDEDGSVALVIDLGGNDTYTHGASANMLKNHPVSIVIDVAGEDRYIGGNDFSFGGALGGVAINWDCGGNDVYIGGNCSCGAGILGVGVLVDEGGDDIYRCKDFCEGAGAFGIGLLLEKVGHDFFHADLYGQGYGSTWGCGMLVDLSGNDVYDAGGAHVDTPLWRDRFTSLSQGFGFGMRPDASGGIGVLVDVSGNDRYSCDIFGQGCSYWFSLGLLIDDDGHDTYCCGQYGQGSGIHLSCGMLLDRHGQDCYYDANGVGMGGAHDWAVGVLVDRDGDDYYSGGGCAQGAGHTNSVGILLDDAGDDGYCAVRGTTQGSGSWVRNTGGIGLLLDGAGKDFYSEPTRDGGVVVKDTIGALIDEPTPPETPHADPMNAAISKEDAAKKVEAGGMADGKWDLDKLWALVTAWEVGDNTVIQPIAREKFIALGKPALDRAFENLNAKDSLITRAIELTLKAFPKDDVVPRLVAKTKDADKFVRKNSVAMLAALNATEAVPRLVEMLTTDADTPGTVLAALATMKTAPPVVASMLKHAKETVAVQAAVCLGAVGDDAAIAALVEALGPDYAFPVRIAATDRLAALGAAAVPLLHEIVIFDNAPVMQRRNALKALGASKTIKAAQAISSGLGGRNRWIRLSAMTAAAELIEALAPPKTGEPSAPTDDDSGTQAFRKLLMLDLDHARELETDPLVKHLVLPPAKR